MYELTSLEISLDAIHQRCLRTRHHQVHLVLLGKGDKSRVIITLDIGIGDLVGSTQTGATVSGSDVDHVDQRRLAQLPCQSMFTAPIADNENAQLFLSHGGSRASIDCVGVSDVGVTAGYAPPPAN